MHVLELCEEAREPTQGEHENPTLIGSTYDLLVTQQH